MKLLWSLFGGLSDGLKDDAALQMHIAADGKMDLVSDKHLVFDDESSQDAYQMGQGSESSDTPLVCRTVASDCRITSSSKHGRNSTTLLHYKFDTMAVQEDYSQDTPVLNQAAAKDLATALDVCEAKCTNDGKCQNFYFLRNKETHEEECWFYEPAGDSKVYIEEKQYYAPSSEESKWDLCIWQPGSKDFVKGSNLCSSKLSRTRAEEDAELAERVRAYNAAKAEKERIFQEGLAKKKQEIKDKAVAERTQFSGDDGESIQFKNVLQGKCLTAPDEPNGNLTFSNCDDTSVKTLWTKGLDGSYESAAHPGRCPRMGDGARCRREYVVLGDCPGFITWSDGYGKVLKLEQDGRTCLGTWAQRSYEDYARLDGSIRKRYVGMVVSPHYQNNVMTTATASKCGNPGTEWERVVTPPYP